MKEPGAHYQTPQRARVLGGLDRVSRSKGIGPTGAQTHYLKRLRAQAGEPRSAMPVTRRECSAEIDRLREKVAETAVAVARKGGAKPSPRHRAWRTSRPARPVTTTTVAKRVAEQVAAGWREQGVTAEDFVARL